MQTDKLLTQADVPDLRAEYEKVARHVQNNLDRFTNALFRQFDATGIDDETRATVMAESEAEAKVLGPRFLELQTALTDLGVINRASAVAQSSAGVAVGGPFP